jgi:uncharacterized protein with PQ loop repeat
MLRNQMHDYLMNIASALFFVCYIPELYANYKNKNANIYNVPEKIVIFIGTSFAFAYSVVNNDTALMANYGPILFLDTTALLMRVFYAVKLKENRILLDPPAIPPESADHQDQSGTELAPTR